MIIHLLFIGDLGAHEIVILIPILLIGIMYLIAREGMKSKLVAYLLLIFFGWLGLHRFYVRKFVSGFLYLFTLGFFGIGCFIDLFVLGGYVDMNNLQYMSMQNWKRNINGTYNQPPIIINNQPPTNNDINNNNDIATQ